MPTTTTFDHSDLNTIHETAYACGMTLTSYSGRFMYGANCVGLEGTVKQLVKFMSRIAINDSVIAEALTDEGPTVDNMGHDFIFYWPAIGIPEEVGVCDECGYAYNVGSTEDHDAEEGLCWTCSPNERPA